jgi:hypothetical protein
MDAGDISFLQTDPVSHKLGLRQHHADIMESLHDLMRTVVSTYEPERTGGVVIFATTSDTSGMHDLFNQLDDVEDFDALF